jgi:hypothetical protein
LRIRCARQALTLRARKAGLDRLDDTGCPVAHDEQRIAEPAAAHVLEEGAHRLGVLLGTRHQMQKHFGARCRKTPGGQHRLALLPGVDAFGDAVDEQIGDLIFPSWSETSLVAIPEVLATVCFRTSCTP